MATYEYCAFTYTTPNDEHEGQYGVDIVAQEIQYGEHGVMSNIGPAIHAWYGQMQDSGSSWSPKNAVTILQREGWRLVGGWTAIHDDSGISGYTASIERTSTLPRP